MKSEMGADGTISFEDIRRMQTDWITPAVAASAMKMDAGRLREYCREGSVPFAVRLTGEGERNVKISRKSFLAAYGYGEPEEDAPKDQVAALVRELRMLTDALKTLIEERRAEHEHVGV